MTIRRDLGALSDSTNEIWLAQLEGVQYSPSLLKRIFLKNISRVYYYSAVLKQTLKDIQEIFIQLCFLGIKVLKLCLFLWFWYYCITMPIDIDESFSEKLEKLFERNR